MPEGLRHIRGLIEQGQFSEAAEAAAAGMAELPDREERVDVLYLLAVARRYAGWHDAASAALDELTALAPAHAPAYQERGHLERARGDAEAAIRAYERAAVLDPALVASWRALVALYREAGDETARRGAAGKLDSLERLPPELLRATSLLNANRLPVAEQVCRDFLARHKTHVEGMRLLAEIAARLKVYDDAQFLLETCLELEPDHVEARQQYLQLLIRRTRFEAAHEQARRLVERDPRNSDFRTSLAAALSGLGRFDEAITVYRQLLAEAPERAPLHVMIGHAQKALGRFGEAVGSYRRAHAIRPDYGDAWWSLANTKTYRFGDHEIRQMQQREAAPDTSSDDRIHLCFALGKALEDAGDCAAAFGYYQRGNGLKQTELQYRDEVIQRRVQAQIETCTPALFERHAGNGCAAADPIFVVGLPRAGSTLLEQILSSHSMVEGTMELHDVLALAQRLRGRSADGRSRYPAILEELDGDLLRRFGEKYLADTRVYRTGKPRFVDKMPNNFLHVGLIRLILPNAKVIDARRHPLACCFSGFKQLFGEGQEFTYGLHEIGRYYDAYVRLMDHWDQVLPGFVLRVMHEDVVDDLEGQVRRLLDFCELPFEPQCLDFHRTDRSIRTPSSEQVKQPIYRSSLEHWRRFEPFLDPLKEALGPALLARYPSPENVVMRALTQRE